MQLCQNVLNWKQAQHKVNHWSKKKRKGENRKAKKYNLSIEKPKDIGYFLFQS